MGAKVHVFIVYQWNVYVRMYVIPPSVITPLFVSSVHTLSQPRYVLLPLIYYSSHPYIFFNQDETSLTFVGFMVSPEGDLIDAHKDVLEQGIMTTQLKEGLKYQEVDFEDDYQSWSKEEMVKKIATVMGLTHVHDPDKSYVLTIDNLLKILAIHMRFR